MEIINVFNNNVALVRDDSGRELVVQGRGVAFHARRGDRLDPALIERRFVPEPAAASEQLAERVAGIPPELIAVAEEILALGPHFGLELDPQATVALADHIAFAVHRVATGQALDHPLEWEVHVIYPREINLGLQALEIIQQRSGIRLPPSEAVPLALHFVNAQAGARVLSEAVQTARLTRDILEIIRAEYGFALARHPSLGEARFATHLRYLFLTHLAGDGYDPLTAGFARSFRLDDARAHHCASRIADYLARKMGWDICADETVYLAFYIHHMASPGRGPSPF